MDHKEFGQFMKKLIDLRKSSYFVNNRAIRDTTKTIRESYIFS